MFFNGLLRKNENKPGHLYIKQKLYYAKKTRFNKMGLQTVVTNVRIMSKLTFFIQKMIESTRSDGNSITTFCRSDERRSDYDVTWRKVYL